MKEGDSSKLSEEPPSDKQSFSQENRQSLEITLGLKVIKKETGEVYSVGALKPGKLGELAILNGPGKLRTAIRVLKLKRSLHSPHGRWRLKSV